VEIRALDHVIVAGSEALNFVERGTYEPGRQLPVYSVEELAILRPPFFSRKSLLPKMAFTFLV
jgi:hypothetical protein